MNQESKEDQTIKKTTYEYVDKNKIIKIEPSTFLRHRGNFNDFTSDYVTRERVRHTLGNRIYSPNTPILYGNNNLFFKTETNEQPLENMPYSIVAVVPTKYENEKPIENIPYSIVRAVKQKNELSNENVPYSIMRTLQESDKVSFEKLIPVVAENKNSEPEDFIIIESTQKPHDEKKTIARIRPRKIDLDETDSDS